MRNANSRLMDEIYQHQRHVYDLTRKYYLLGRDRLIDELVPPPGGRVLEIGCGTGRNLIRAARKYPEALFYGIDISAEMLQTARTEIAKAGLSERIFIAQADAVSFSSNALFRRDRFDRVFFSYSLSMIPNWEGALRQAYRATGTNGQLQIVDFGEQNRLPRWFRRLLAWWLTKFHVCPREELESELKRLGSYSFQSLYRDYARLGTVTRGPQTSNTSHM